MNQSFIVFHKKLIIRNYERAFLYGAVAKNIESFSNATAILWHKVRIEFTLSAKLVY